MNYSTTVSILKERPENNSVINVAENHDSRQLDYIFIPDNHEYIKVRHRDILYVEADGSYVKIFTDLKVYQISTNLKHFNEQFHHPDFIRISRKHVVNINYTERINGICLIIKNNAGEEQKLPFSKRKRQDILKALPVIKIKH